MKKGNERPKDKELELILIRPEPREVSEEEIKNFYKKFALTLIFGA